MSELVQEGQMPLNEAEQGAISALKEKHPGEMRSFTRTQPGETGPLHVTVGDDVYEVSEDGKAVKLDG